VYKADKITTFVNCLEIWEPQPPGTPQGLSRPVMGLLFFFFFFLYIYIYIYIYIYVCVCVCVCIAVGGSQGINCDWNSRRAIKYKWLTLMYYRKVNIMEENPKYLSIPV